MRAIVALGIFLAIAMLGVAINQIGLLSRDVATVGTAATTRFSNYWPLFIILLGTFAAVGFLILGLSRR